MAQNTRNCEMQEQSWVKYIDEQIRSYSFQLQLVVNMDETNCHFDNTGSMSWIHKGVRTVIVKRSGSKQRCTIALAVSLAGQKLQPRIILKTRELEQLGRSAKNTPMIFKSLSTRKHGWEESP